MAKDDRHSAIERLYGAGAEKPQARTYVCFGVSRGGTSAVAGTMQRLGLFIGDNLPNNYEDPDFVGKPPPAMIETIAERQKTYAVWGWKFPSAANYLENLMPALENPHLILVSRDIVATMKAHRRWHNRGQVLAVHEILLQQQRNWFLIERWRVPTIMVSYEKAVLQPALFATQMAEFLGMPAPDDAAQAEITSFMQPGSYK